MENMIVGFDGNTITVISGINKENVSHYVATHGIENAITEMLRDYPDVPQEDLDFIRKNA